MAAQAACSLQRVAGAFARGLAVVIGRAGRRHGRDPICIKAGDAMA